MATNKIWRWYRRHKEAVGLILEFAKEAVPGMGIFVRTLQVVAAQVNDNRDIIEKEKLEEIERTLEEIKPAMSDVVDDIEDNPDFARICELPEQEMLQRGQKILSEDDDIHEELEKIMPQLSQSLIVSIAKLENKDNKQVISGRYELLEKIGRGGQGEVWKAKHILAEAIMAIKFLPTELTEDENAIVCVREEYKRVVQLIHPNIVQYREFDYDSESRRYFLVMDYIPGTTLRVTLMRLRREPMEFDKAIQFLKPIGDALDFAHQQKIVHCDLKPENILIRESDNACLLTDFGLAKEIRNSLSMRSMKVDISGTMPYMAPEQYKGRNATAETDMWALGIILYEMIAGHHPFQGTSFDHYKDLICNEEVERPINIKDSEWVSLGKMLAKDKQQRIAHFDEIRLTAENKTTEQKDELNNKQAKEMVKLQEQNRLLEEQIAREKEKNLFEAMPKGITEVRASYFEEDVAPVQTTIGEQQDRFPNTKEIDSFVALASETVEKIVEKPVELSPVPEISQQSLQSPSSQEQERMTLLAKIPNDVVQEFVEKHKGTWDYQQYHKFLQEIRQQIGDFPEDLFAEILGEAKENFRQQNQSSSSKEIIQQFTANLKRLEISGLVTQFIQKNKGEWEKKDWLELRKDLQQKGFYPLYDKDVLVLLEKSKQQYNELKQEVQEKIEIVEALEMAHDYERALEVLREIHVSGFWNQEIEQKEQHLSANKENFSKALTEGRTLFNIGKIDISLAKLEQAYKLRPRDIATNELLAKVKAEVGIRDQKCVEFLAEGDSYLKRKLYLEAIDTWKKGLGGKQNNVIQKRISDVTKKIEQLATLVEAIEDIYRKQEKGWEDWSKAQQLCKNIEEEYPHYSEKEQVSQWLGEIKKALTKKYQETIINAEQIAWSQGQFKEAITILEAIPQTWEAQPDYLLLREKILSRLTEQELLEYQIYRRFSEYKSRFTSRLYSQIHHNKIFCRSSANVQKQTYLLVS